MNNVVSIFSKKRKGFKIPEDFFDEIFCDFSKYYSERNENKIQDLSEQIDLVLEKLDIDDDSSLKLILVRNFILKFLSLN
jgi:hypothetical protein